MRPSIDPDLTYAVLIFNESHAGRMFLVSTIRRVRPQCTGAIEPLSASGVADRQRPRTVPPITAAPDARRVRGPAALRCGVHDRPSS